MADEDGKKTEGESSEAREEREAEEILAKAINGEDEDEDDEDEDDDTSSGGDSSSSKKSSDSSKGEDDKVSRAELDKATRRRQIMRRKLKQTQDEMAELRKKFESADETARREEREKALKEQEGKFKPLLVQAGAERELLDANVKGGKKGIARVIKLMNLDEIDVTDDGDLDGLDEQIVQIKEDYPEFFTEDGKKEEESEEEEERPARKRTRNRSSSRSIDGASKSSRGAEKQSGGKKNGESTSELLFRGLTGRPPGK